MHPHLSNASVAIQPAELLALGYSGPVVVLHWIFSLELLPLAGGDTPVCGAARAWRFRCVPPCLLGASTCGSADFPSDDCALFCALLSEEHGGATPSRPFGCFGRDANASMFSPASKAIHLRSACCVQRLSTRTLCCRSMLKPVLGRTRCVPDCGLLSLLLLRGLSSAVRPTAVLCCRSLGTPR